MTIAAATGCFFCRALLRCFISVGDGPCEVTHDVEVVGNERVKVRLANLEKLDVDSSEFVAKFVRSRDEVAIAGEREHKARAQRADQNRVPFRVMRLHSSAVQFV